MKQEAEILSSSDTINTSKSLYQVIMIILLVSPGKTLCVRQLWFHPHVAAFIF